jgi:hypothetical protein
MKSSTIAPSPLPAQVAPELQGRCLVVPVIGATGERKNAAPMSGRLNDASKSAPATGPGVHRPFRSRVSPFAPSGESMNKVDLSAVWAPTVLGKDRIDQRRWAYAVAAPFDMPADMPGLVGMKVQLDGAFSRSAASCRECRPCRSKRAKRSSCSCARRPHHRCSACRRGHHRPGRKGA